MKQFLKAASKVVLCVNYHRRTIGLILTAIVTLIGADVVTEEPIIPPELTPQPVQRIIEGGTT